MGPERYREFHHCRTARFAGKREAKRAFIAAISQRVAHLLAQQQEQQEPQAGHNASARCPAALVKTGPALQLLEFLAYDRVGRVVETARAAGGADCWDAALVQREPLTVQAVRQAAALLGSVAPEASSALEAAKLGASRNTQLKSAHAAAASAAAKLEQDLAKSAAIGSPAAARAPASPAVETPSSAQLASRIAARSSTPRRRAGGRTAGARF